MSNETNLPSQYDSDSGCDPAFIAEQQRILDEAAARVQSRTAEDDDRHTSSLIQPTPDRARPEYYVPISTQDVVMNQPVLQTVTTQKPESHIGLSVFTFLCCCMPLGLIAIIMSLKSANASEKGKYEKARCFSKTAQWFNVASIATALIILTIVLIIDHGNK